MAAVIACISAAPYTTSWVTLDVADYDQYPVFMSSIFQQDVSVSYVLSSNYTSVAKYSQLPPVYTAPPHTDYESTTVAYKNYVSYAYNLLSGSQIDGYYNSTQLVDFYIIEGKSTYDAWQNGDRVQYARQYYGNTNRFSYRTSSYASGRDVYLVFDNDYTYSYTASINAVFTVTAVMYDTSRNSSYLMTACTSYPCTLPITYNSNEVVIIEGLPNKNVANAVRYVNYRIGGRAGPYVAICLSVCGVLFACCMFVWCRLRRQRAAAAAAASVVTIAPETPTVTPGGVMPAFQAPVYESEKTALLAAPQFTPYPPTADATDPVRPPSVNPELI